MALINDPLAVSTGLGVVMVDINKGFPKVIALLQPACCK
jgi:hypothetical protein